MTYQWNMPGVLLEQDVIDERADDLVETPEVEADDRARDDHDDDALERLRAARPIDLPQLGIRLPYELPALLRLPPSGLLLDGLLGRPRLNLAPAPCRGAVSCRRSGRTSLPTRLAGH